MSFSDLYWPILAAFLTTFAILEVFHFFLGRWIAKRYERKQKEEMDRQKEELARLIAAGVDPALLFGGGLPMGAPIPSAVIPDPGEKKEDEEGDKNDAEVPSGYL